MTKAATAEKFEVEIIGETHYRVEIPWRTIGGRHFPAVESLFKSGVIERQAWRIENYTHYCIFYFRVEDDAEKFVKAIGGRRVAD